MLAIVFSFPRTDDAVDENIKKVYICQMHIGWGCYATNNGH